MATKEKSSKPTEKEQVTTWMDNLDPAMKPAIEEVRTGGVQMVLATRSQKWI